MRDHWWHFALKDMDLKSYRISRGTAWRCLKELEKAGYIQKAQWDISHGEKPSNIKSWELTEEFKARFNQYKLEDTERFLSDLDSILVFDDQVFQQQIREKVHKLIKQHEKQSQ